MSNKRWSSILYPRRKNLFAAIRGVYDFLEGFCKFITRGMHLFEMKSLT